ncbi:MAG: CapA family protein [Patescibacteria group bacterium]
MIRFFYASVFVSGLLALAAAILVLFPLHSPDSSPTTSQPTATLPVAADAPPEPVSLLFFGDIMLGRNVENHTNQKGDDYPYEKLRELIHSVDFAFVNLEGPIVSNHSQTPTGSFVFSFKDTSAEALARAGFDGVSLANNHTLNQGESGFVETQQFLEEAGILYTGHPFNMDASYAFQTTVRDLPLTFIGFNMTFPTDDPEAAVATIAELSRASQNQIIVMMHWGNEYEPHSDKRQQDLAHDLINAGADLVVGAHPHVVQEIEEYNGKLIFYSLGNFIFDQYFSVETQQELGVKFAIDEKGIISATLYPIESIASQPQLMDETDRQNFLKALAERSDEALAPEIEAGVLTLTAE